jgi:xylitol oxidase
LEERNWGGNYAYRAAKLRRPATLEQLQEVVASSPQIRVLGSRHSFTDIGDSSELVTLAGLPADVEVDRDAGTVSFNGGISYGTLAGKLQEEGLALHNLASLPHISVAGAVATATHGSGNANGNLATAIAGLQVLTSDGEVITASRGDADFNGLAVSLGAVGAVTRLTLEVEPTYQVRQRVFEGLAWDALFEHFDEVTGAGYSVSVFTKWGRTADMVWVKSRANDAPEVERHELFGAVPATVERHPVLGLDPVNCTPQLGLAGPWFDRLPHFLMGFTPSTGAEIQSEYVVPRRHGIATIEALLALGGRMRPVLQTAEIRTIARDDLWMSPQNGQDTVAIHFTWKPDQAAVEGVLADMESSLERFEARPHWGKLFLADAAAIAPLYPRLPDFRRLVERLDRRGAFRNRWLETYVLGAA